MSQGGQHHSFAPTDGMTYNPNDPRYFDANALQGELKRTFDLCQSCRLCFKYCQSFPTLFRAVDDNDGDARTLDDGVLRQVVDECFGCQLCYVKCPYTVADDHEYQLDFPALMLRARAVRVQREGVPAREKMLSDPDRLGRQGTMFPALANTANRTRAFRVLLEKATGIHRDKQLPSFEKPTFDTWFAKQTDGRRETSNSSHRVVLFATCFVNYNNPTVGRDAVDVLTHNQCQVACPEVNCCGMPALDAGDVKTAKQRARRNVEQLLPFVERGYRIAVINPTCSLMLRHEYPLLLDDPDDRPMADAAKQVADATRDICEFLFELRKAGELREDYRSTPGSDIAYHVPCHLRRQAIGFPAQQLMKRIPGVKVHRVEQCSGHDGTWAMKREYYTLSLQNGKKAFEEMQDVKTEVWASDCPLAAVQFEQATGRCPLHPVQILARAYRKDGFPHPTETAGEETTAT